MTVYGSLKAQGAQTNRISFTRSPAQSCGGGIAFSGTSVNSLSTTGVFDYCDFSLLTRDAGVVAGQYAEMSVSHSTFSNTISSGSGAIYLTSSRISVIGNSMCDSLNGILAVGCTGLIASNTVSLNDGSDDDCIELQQDWSGPGDQTILVLGNHVGNDTGSNADGIDFNGVTSASIIGNTIRNCGDKGISYGLGGDGITSSSGLILNNFISNCAIGIAIKDGSDPLFANNTIVSCSYGIASYIKTGTHGGRGCATNIIIWGCITNIDLRNDSTLDVGYSCIQGTTVWPGIGNTTNYPKFLGSAYGDYRLQTNSPCVDAGLNMDWMTDYADPDGNSRIINGTVDMGAYEMNPGQRLLELYTPNTGDTLTVGGTYPIKWMPCGTNWPSGATIHIRVSTNNGGTWSDIPGATNILLSPYVEGTFNWNTAGLAATNACMLMVYCNQDPATSDKSAGAFSMVLPILDHFHWDPISSSKTSDISFAVGITAVNTNDITVTGFLQPVNLSAWVGTQADVTVGYDTTSWDYPLSTTNDDVRVQTIYLANEVDGARTIRSLAINVASLPAVVMTNWTIRMKHTPLSSYIASPAWETNEWTTVYQADQAMTSTGWVSFLFTTPFVYNGTSNLMVDFSFNGVGHKYSGTCLSSATPQPRTIYYRSNSADGDPLAWSSTNRPVPTAIARIANIRLSARTPVAMTPSATGGFTNGRWTGNVTVSDGATGMCLYADDLNGHTGNSSVFDTTNLGVLSIIMPAQAREGDWILATPGVVTVQPAPSSPLAVTVVSSDISEVGVTPLVTIPAGQTSTTFTITINDDAIHDGSHVATVTASAPSYATATAAMTVQDNEIATLSVSVPANATEGDGLLATAGTVRVSALVGDDVRVALTSSDPNTVTVPDTVVIQAGATSAVFDVVVIDDNKLDFTRTVTITAHVDYWTNGTASINIFDNENTNMVVLIPSSAREGDGVLVNAGGVYISGTISSNLVVNLASSSTTEVSVVNSVTIPAGQTSAVFNIMVLDDTITDGTQHPWITASAAGFKTGSNTISILDNDVHHFGFAAIASPQYKGIPFAITVTAQDINSVTIPTFSGTVTLTAAGDGGAAPLSPTGTTAFVNGQWSGLIRVNKADTNMKLTAADSTEHTGQSGAFNVSSVLINHFDWGTIASPQRVNGAFAVTVTAKGSNGVAVTDYAGTNTLAGLYLTQREQTNGTGVATSSYPMNTTYHDARLQVIYSSSTIGVSRAFNTLSLKVAQIPGIVMTNWTIRMKHTSLSAYPASPSWDGAGWTTVYQSNQGIPSTGWITFPFNSAFNYNSASNLMIDFSYNGDAHSTIGGTCLVTVVSQTNSIYYGTDSGYGDPLLWSGTNNPVPRTTTTYPNIKLGWSTEVPVSVSPTSIASFVDGVWIGNVTVMQAATNMFLRTGDGKGHTNDSPAFTMQFWRDLLVTSPCGTAIPPVGTSSYPDGSSVACAILDSPVYAGAMATQYVCTGWTGTGSVPQGGTETNTPAFTILADSTITWLWQTNVYLDTETTPGGSIDVADGWFPFGPNVVITATPLKNRHLNGWSGDTGSCTFAGNQITVPMNKTRLIVAEFVPDIIITNFGYSMKIRFAGYGAGETLTNFPALVVLNQARNCNYGPTPTNLNYGQFASPNGYDLRFTDTDTNLLTYEPENWNTNGDSYVWVQVPLLTGTNTCIWAWWGSTNDVVRPPYTTNGATWTGDYIGVWHLKQAQAGISNAALYFDSTALGNDGLDNVSATGKSGVVYLGQQFNGTNDYIQLEPAPASSAPLGTPNFTLSIWFDRSGTGVTASTGGSGLNSEPLLTKGRGEYDGDNRDMNYFLGIDPTTLRLSADFEEDGTGTTPGLNHPVYGTTAVPSNNWCFAAVSYDGTWNLYLNGKLDSQTYVGQPPRWDSIQPAAIAAALDSTGAPQGAFNGCLDEARVAAVAQSANWIKACYTTVASNNVFTVYTAEPFLASSHNSTLTVASALGGANPAVGPHVYVGGSLVICAIANSPLLNNTTQYVCTGWTGTGSAPASGYRTNTPAFFLVTDSSVTWNWQTNYWLHTAANGSGTVDVADSWRPYGTNVVINATPNRYYHLGLWSGDTNGSPTGSNSITVIMNSSRAIIANFATNYAPLGTPEWWLGSFGLTNQSPAAEETMDSDGDGQLNWQEWVAGTIPTNALSVFEITGIASPGNGRLPVTFSSVSGRVYNIWERYGLLTGSWGSAQYATNEAGGFTTAPITGTVNTITVYPEAPGGQYYYRVTVNPQ
jgi:parallel beta-helix repeat protein